MLDKSTKKKEDRMCKIAIRNAGMKQDDIARVSNVSQSAVSRPLKEHRESGSIRKRKRSTLILEFKELLLKHFGTWCCEVLGPRVRFICHFLSFMSMNNDNPM